MRSISFGVKNIKQRISGRDFMLRLECIWEMDIKDLLEIVLKLRSNVLEKMSGLLSLFVS